MIFVNEPIISQKAKDYVNICLNTGWISSNGPFIEQFEERFAHYIGSSYAITTTSGTTALHLALTALGVGPGDEVIIPDLTIISCAFVCMYGGAKPVFVDVEYETATIDPRKIEAAITSNTKAIMAVHLYGQSANLRAIQAIAKKHKLSLIEDAAEAIGVEHSGKKVGTIGDIGVFSFYANKLITTGEGGMVVTHNKKIAERLWSLKNLSHSPKKRFFHEQIGFNYRMTNISAAIGLANLEEIENYILRKRQIEKKYRELLTGIPFIEIPRNDMYGKSLCWMFNLLVSKKAPFTREDLLTYLHQHGVETRTYFYSLHSQPVLRSYISRQFKYPVSQDLSQRGFYMPSGLAISDEQIEAVVSSVKKFIRKFKA